MNPTNAKSTLNPTTASFTPSGQTTHGSSLADSRGSRSVDLEYDLSRFAYAPGAQVCQTTHEDGHTAMWDWSTAPYFAKLVFEHRHDVAAGLTREIDDTKNNGYGIDLFRIMSLPLDEVHHSQNRALDMPIRLEHLNPQSRKFIESIISFKRGVVSKDREFQDFNDIRSIEFKISPDIWDKKSYDEAEAAWHRVTNNLDRILLENSTTEYNKWDDAKSKEFLLSLRKPSESTNAVDTFDKGMRADLGWDVSVVHVAPTASTCKIFGDESGNPNAVPYIAPTHSQFRQGLPQQYSGYLTPSQYWFRRQIPNEVYQGRPSSSHMSIPPVNYPAPMSVGNTTGEPTQAFGHPSQERNVPPPGTPNIQGSWTPSGERLMPAWQFSPNPSANWDGSSK